MLCSAAVHNLQDAGWKPVPVPTAFFLPGLMSFGDLSQRTGCGDTMLKYCAIEYHLLDRQVFPVPEK
jgi:hypothetical protein